METFARQQELVRGVAILLHFKENGRVSYGPNGGGRGMRDETRQGDERAKGFIHEGRPCLLRRIVLLLSGAFLGELNVRVRLGHLLLEKDLKELPRQRGEKTKRGEREGADGGEFFLATNAAPSAKNWQQGK